MRDARGDDGTVLVVECELRVEEVGIGDLLADAAGERLPYLPEPVHIGVVAEEDGIGCRKLERQHLHAIHPAVHAGVRSDLERARAAAAEVAEPVWHPVEDERRDPDAHHVDEHQVRVSGADLRRILGARARERHFEIDKPLRIQRAGGARRIVERRRFVDGTRYQAHLLRVHPRHHVGLRLLRRLVVPVPERQRERVVVD